MRKILLYLLLIILCLNIPTAAHALLLDMGDATIYDAKNQLSWLKDASLGGSRNWYDALDWADNLVFANFDDWRLPFADSTCGDRYTNTYDCTESEMGNLYYVELENNAAYGGPADPLKTGPFVNLQSYGYWTNTGTLGGAWVFNFSGGAQGVGAVVQNFNTWAVRLGERVSPVPDSSTTLLLSTSLLGLVGASRKKFKGK